MLENPFCFRKDPGGQMKIKNKERIIKFKLEEILEKCVIDMRTFYKQRPT